jgi:branched-subunit amino acid aminotransferase/4-amino-4-deoxychorismate lyase
MIVYLNGKFIPESKAVIPITDHGFLYGDGVYETIRVYKGKPFLLSRHLLRLNDSLRGIQRSARPKRAA